MTKNIEKKKKQVDELVNEIKNSSSILTLDYSGLTVSEMTFLRREFLKKNISVKIIKNNITRRAMNILDCKEIESSLQGPTAIVFSREEPTESIRIASKFSQEHENLKLKAAIVENKYTDKDKVLELAKLPNKEGMYSMLLSVLQAPIRNLAYVTKQISEKKE